MAKKGIVGETVRAAVTAAQRAIAPSPLAKRMIAAAAAQAVDMAEARTKQTLPAVEKAVREAVQQGIVKPVDSLLGAGEPQPAKPGRRKTAGKKAAARKATGGKRASARTKATKKPARPRAAPSRKPSARKSSRKTARARTRRR